MLAEMPLFALAYVAGETAILTLVSVGILGCSSTRDLNSPPPILANAPSALCIAKLRVF